MPDRPTILLLDGHSLAFRAFYALPDTLRTQTGQLTNAVYGFTSMLIKMLSERRPDAVLVAFDKGRDIARTEAYPEYKATRTTPPDEFRPQVDLIKQVLEALTIPIAEVAGVEADDVLATIATRAIDAGFHAYIVTGDRDAMQLADEHLTILYTLRGISEMAEMTPEAITEKYGVPPGSYVDYAALRGDNSDNLPGVPGVGEKTAAKLITEYGDIDGVYAHLDDISGKKVPAMLAEHEDQVRINRKVMRLRRDVDVDADLADLRLGSAEGDPTRWSGSAEGDSARWSGSAEGDPARWLGGIDMPALRQLFGALEFRVLLDRFVDEVLGDVEEEQATAFDRTPQRLEEGELRSWLDGLTGPLAVHPEVSDRVPHLSFDAVGIAAPDRDPASVRFAEVGPGDLDALGAALADPDLAKVVHDVKTLHHAVAVRGWELANVTLDTLLAAYLLNPEQRSFDLERVAVQYLQRTLQHGDGEDAGDQLSLGIDEDPWEDRALRALATLELAEHLSPQLEERGQDGLMHTIEAPLAPVLARMEENGIALDLHVLDEIRDRLGARVADLEDEIYDCAGREFNIGSGPQLQQILFEEMELPKTRRIKTGYSTDALALQGLAGMDPIIEPILEWREMTKLLSTYVDALPPLLDPETGRIHTTLSQTVAATGRLSSTNPNLQNIPVRREEGREIRRAFVPGEGFDRFLVADYSQIELRVMAHMCADEGLLEAFRSGEDVHATTAAKVFDLPLDQVDGALRDRAKVINYGLAYGLTPFGVGQKLGIPPDEAIEIVEAYMTRFPKVREFLDAAVLQARRDGYTTTLFGRRRYLPDLLSDNRNRRQMAERMALNAPIQGTAADIMKLAMIRVQEALDASDLDAQLLLQVHDEVILEVTEADADALRELVVSAMSGVADLAVPLDVDTALGTTWFDAQKH